jgi:hypothetical protein
VSIQAVAWALEQDLPARPKLVLVSIANHADHRTGYCWLKAETIADEASCSPRGVFNFVGDLIRNGFIRRSQKKGDDGKQRANDYWILFDREPVEWNGDRPKAAPEEVDDDSADAEAAPDDTTISGDPHAPGASGETPAEAPPDPVEKPPGAVGPHAPACSRKDSEEPSKTKPEKSGADNRFAAPPRSYHAPPIVPEPQGATHTQTNARLFVIKGSRAWDAWMDHRLRVEAKRSCPTYRKFIEGLGMRDGWDFPTLFPPGGETGKESAEAGTGTDPPAKKTA